MIVTLASTLQLLVLARALAPNQNWNAITRYFCVTLHGIALCVFVLHYVTVNLITYENNKNSFKWSVPN